MSSNDEADPALHVNLKHANCSTADSRSARTEERFLG
jgi:hypothetical protein